MPQVDSGTTPGKAEGGAWRASVATPPVAWGPPGQRGGLTDVKVSNITAL